MLDHASKLDAFRRLNPFNFSVLEEFKILQVRDPVTAEMCHTAHLVLRDDRTSPSRHLTLECRRVRQLEFKQGEFSLINFFLGVAVSPESGDFLVFDQEQSETLQFECAEFHAYAEDQRA